MFYSFGQTAPRKPRRSSGWLRGTAAGRAPKALHETAAQPELSQGEMTLSLSWATVKCFQEETVFLLSVSMANSARSHLIQQPLGRTPPHTHSASQMLPEASKAQGLPLIFTCAGWPNKTIYQASVCLCCPNCNQINVPVIQRSADKTGPCRVSPAKTSLWLPCTPVKAQRVRLLMPTAE